MRQVKIPYNKVDAALRDIYGMNLQTVENGQAMSILPGLVQFISDARTGIQLNRLGKKLEAESKFFQEERERVAKEIFGEDKTKWAPSIEVPEDESIPEKLTVAENESIPETIEEVGTGRQIANPEYKTKEIPNPDYKTKTVKNDKWEEFTEKLKKMGESETEVQSFEFTDNLFDGVSLTYCEVIERPVNASGSEYGPYYRIASHSKDNESLSVLTPSVFFEYFVLVPVTAENLKSVGK